MLQTRFLSSILKAVDFVKENLGICMEQPKSDALMAVKIISVWETLSFLQKKKEDRFHLRAQFLQEPNCRSAGKKIFV